MVSINSEMPASQRHHEGVLNQLAPREHHPASWKMLGTLQISSTLTVSPTVRVSGLIKGRRMACSKTVTSTILATNEAER
eukprot:m.250577 g.250577  ORF g.250577 m.250577 type:complete len:80 (+) comp17177_c0_seq7:341-580(+)